VREKYSLVLISGSFSLKWYDIVQARKTFSITIDDVTQARGVCLSNVQPRGW